MVERINNNRERDKIIIEDHSSDSKVDNILNPNSKVRQLVREILGNR